MTPLQKLPKNVRDLGKLIVAKGLKKLSKVQKIAQSGHTDGSTYRISLPMPRQYVGIQCLIFSLFILVHCGVKPYSARALSLTSILMVKK